MVSLSDLEIHEGWRSLEQCQGSLKALVFLGTFPALHSPQSMKKNIPAPQKGVNIWAENAQAVAGPIDGMSIPRKELK